MNRNISAVILIVLAIGMYLTFTSKKWDEVNAIRAVNDQYAQAINNADNLIQIRNKVLNDYNALSAVDQDRLDKMIPNTVDTIRLIIDLKNIAQRRGLFLQDIKAGTDTTTQKNTIQQAPPAPGTVPTPTLDSVKVSFTVSASYQQFLTLLRDIESDLRISDITHLAMQQNEVGSYDFDVELNTYWLRDH